MAENNSLTHTEAQESEARRALFRQSSGRKGSALLKDHAIPDLKEASFSLWLCCLVATVVPAAMTLSITSDVTPLGRQAFHDVWWLNDLLGANLNVTVGHRLPSGILGDDVGFITFYSLAGVGLAIGWLVDVHLWRCLCLKLPYIILNLAVLLVAVILHAEDYPWLWIIIGVCATMLNLTGLRSCCFSEKPDFRTFNFVVATVLLLNSLALASLWALWAFSPWLGFHPEAEGLAEGTAVDGTNLTYVFLWMSPALLSILYLVCSLFMYARCQFHIPETGDLHIGMGQMDNVYVGAELKFALYCLIFVACLVWIGVSVAGLGAGLSDMVLQTSAAMFVLISIYIFVPIGTDRIVAAAKEHEWIQYIMQLFTNDWMKAVFLLVLWPVVPLYFIVGAIQQAARLMLSKCGIIDAPGGTCCLTEQTALSWKHLTAWDWASVLPKSIAAGIAYFVLQVGASLGTTIFLSWLAETIASWPLYAICGIIFFVGLTMFLIPVVPGLPIYLVAGIVVVQRCQVDDIDFIYGVSIASLLCWLIKLSSNVVLMKFVGDPYADDVKVRMMVGTHTPTMRAAAIVLTEPGLTVPKVAVLVGGPDWPTAVICSMLKVPVCSMLIGTSPVMFLIIPVVLAASYTLAAGIAEKEGKEELAALNTQISTIMMAVSAVGQLGSMIVAGMYLQATKKEHEAELSSEREEDRDVLDAVRSEERKNQKYLKQTAWDLMPCWLKFLLFMGSFAICGMMHIVMAYFTAPFRSFSLTDSVCDPKGLKCNPLNVVLPSGWVGTGLLGFAIFCQAMCSLWCKCTTTGSADTIETESLTTE